MTRVTGIDLSLTSTGVAVIVDGHTHRITTLASKGHRGDTVPQRAKRLASIVDDVWNEIFDADLTVIEGPSFASSGAGTWDRAGLWWLVMSELQTERFPVAIVPPTVVKKFAAGKGNADKSAVAAGLARLWPEAQASNNNEWDALALATIGAQSMGLDVPRRAHHAECLAKVEWPPIPDWEMELIAQDTVFERTQDAAQGDDRCQP
jgi:crossover junction endodeoxyribonuclease RuvC